MIPTTDSLLNNLITVETYPSKTYKLNLDSNTVGGYVEDVESVRQAIYNILNTERYEYLAFSWDYGIELVDLIGMPYDYVCAEIERRIEEALTMDDRIESVSDYEFEKTSRNKILATFTVNTVYGDVDAELEVET